MKKACFLTLLLPVFIAASLYAGNKDRVAFHGNILPATTNAHAYPKIDKQQLPALFEKDIFFAGVVYTAGSGFQKNISSDRIYGAFSAGYPAGTTFSAGNDDFLMQKKYLFCIYPSHNFW